MAVPLVLRRPGHRPLVLLASALLASAFALPTAPTLDRGQASPSAPPHRPPVATPLVLLDTLALRTDPWSRLTFSPDGALLALWGSAAHARLIDAGTGRPLATLRADGPPASVLAFSPDAKVLATGHADGVLRLWHRQSERAGAAFPAHEGGVTSLAFAPGGALASGGRDGRVRLWPSTGRRDRPGPALVHQATVTALAFSPGGTRLAVGDAQGGVVLWDLSGRPRDLVGAGELRRLRVDHPVSHLRFSPDGRVLAAAGARRTTLWWASIGTAAGAFGTTAVVTDLALSPDGVLVTTVGLDGAVRSWEAANGRPLAALRAAVWPSAIAYAARRGLLATLGDAGEPGSPPDQEPAIRLWALPPP
jgi:WD40 repeat protein